MKIFLIGYRCTGKTTIGKRLSQQLGFKFIDTDKIIEQQIGSSILHCVETHGWDHFRRIEKQVLFNTKNLEHTVVSTGGGIVIDPENQTFIHDNGYAIWLDADINTILLRLNADTKTGSSRPPLTHKDLLNETQELLHTRRPFYENTAHVRIEVSFLTPEEIVHIIDRRVSDVRQQLW